MEVQMSKWQMQDAKAKFAEVLDKAAGEGPQVITRRGQDAAVIVSAATWREIERRARPTIIDLLLSDEARSDDLTPPRRTRRRRPAPQFSE
jgi:antitoxin Phd